MFRRPSVRYGRTPEPETPYQKAAQAWDERIGAARLQARNWRLIAFGALGPALHGGGPLNGDRHRRRAWLQRQRQRHRVSAPARQQQQPRSNRSANHTTQPQYPADPHRPPGVSGAGDHQSRPRPRSVSGLTDPARRRARFYREVKTVTDLKLGPLPRQTTMPTRPSTAGSTNLSKPQH
jgi:hypothetical protein